MNGSNVLVVVSACRCYGRICGHNLREPKHVGAIFYIYTYILMCFQKSTIYTIEYISWMIKCDIIEFGFHGSVHHVDCSK